MRNLCSFSTAGEFILLYRNEFENRIAWNGSSGWRCGNIHDSRAERRKSTVKIYDDIMHKLQLCFN